MESLYCRFCAELKSPEGVLNFDSDEEKCNEILVKLSFLNAMYVNVSPHSVLPQTVCYMCYDSLNKAYEFLDKVKRAQDVLSNLFPEPSKFDFSDDDRAALDDFFAENDDLPGVKDENSASDPGIVSVTDDINIKFEPKDEDDMPFLEAQSSEANVQEIIDDALIVKKEVLDELDSKIQSWKDYPWVCAFCCIEFTNINDLRTHSKDVHNKCAAFSCIDCTDLKYHSFTAATKHITEHRKVLGNRCPFCDEVIDGAGKMKSHTKKHFPKPCHQCINCAEVFLKKEELNQHLKDFTLHKKRPRRNGKVLTQEDLTCNICQKVYKNRNSLRDHKRHQHSENRGRNYTCDRCGKTFLTKGTLTCHVMAHDQVKSHVCRICNKSFMFPNMLRRHVDMHTGVKPFSCEICGRGFRLQYQLNMHKIVHTDSMPHVCKFCNKAFRFKQILKNHLNQHTGAKPYSCQHCFMEFANWSNYNKHMKRRHNVDTAKKKITPGGTFPVNPVTGQIIQEEVQDMEEWKSKIMIPGKRGKKKIMKENT